MKVVVVEDEILIREGLCELMRKMFPELVIAGVAGNGRENIMNNSIKKWNVNRY